jgi:hypothetical protein
MTTPEERLVRSLPALRALIDSLAARSPSEAGDLLRLDFLVRRYPAAARMSLRLLQPVPVGRPAPPGWAPAPDVDGIPGWRWRGGPVYVATSDLDQLRFIGVALRRFDHMTADELHAYLGERPAGRC